MNMLETPWDYIPAKRKDSIVVSIINEMEIAQGSPIVGDLKINNTLVNQNCKFGGPIIINNEFVYCTVFFRGGFLKSSGFKIAKINILSLDFFFIGDKEFLIWIQKVENNQILFRKSLYGNPEDVYFVNNF
ncbi:hypothetical protein DVK85_09395 [Flavobacterium arcticum]|uniref:Uncharacterized protein n=1 Tax=Flavobacterium arcticum TaxID=1784713 RepID=A0A345HCX5_9FLAO|nr:hypothetical protein [Flavobacterium arcticum]AXG74435.1 hypothetical protein DVK85_09395 [Flavobacterium arcticum]KAF2512444.1 hypothetical protein E0W72_04270 [Flavobacterium arcticum]